MCPIPVKYALRGDKMFKREFNIFCLDCHLHSVLEWPRGDMGGTVPFSFGVPCPEYWPLAAEELFGALLLFL